MRSLIVHNARSGFGSDAVFEFERTLACPGDECVVRVLPETEGAIDARAARSAVADAENFDLVVASGGDSTMAALLAALAGREVLTCVFPSGSQNLLFEGLGNAAEPSSIARSCRVGSSTAIDIAEVAWRDEAGDWRRKPFVLSAGTPYDALLMQAAVAGGWGMVRAARISAGIARQRPELSTYDVVTDGEWHTLEGISCTVANCAATPGGVVLSEESSLVDGLLDVFVLACERSDGRGLKGVRDGEGVTLTTPHLVRLTGRDVRVRSSAPMCLMVDGEGAVAGVTSFAARALPGAARLVVDRTSRYRAEGDPLDHDFGHASEKAFPEA